MFPKILCIIPALPQDVNLMTLRSIWNQTVKVTETLILTGCPKADTLPAKISKVLNNGLKNVNLKAYDYLLRVDCDSILPANFIEANLKDDPDVVGFGQGQLIKVSTFFEVMDGRFFDEQDDSYVRFKFASANKKSVNCTVEPVVVRENGAVHSIQYFVDRGTLLYRFGYEPVHVVAKILLQGKNALALVGYVKAWLKREKQFDVAGYVRWYQVQHFLHPRRLLGRMRAYL